MLWVSRPVHGRAFLLTHSILTVGSPSPSSIFQLPCRRELKTPLHGHDSVVVLLFSKVFWNYDVGHLLKVSASFKLRSVGFLIGLGNDWHTVEHGQGGGLLNISVEESHISTHRIFWFFSCIFSHIMVSPTLGLCKPHTKA